MSGGRYPRRSTRNQISNQKDVANAPESNDITPCVNEKQPSRGIHKDVGEIEPKEVQRSHHNISTVSLLSDDESIRNSPSASDASESPTASSRQNENEEDAEIEKPTIVISKDTSFAAQRSTLVKPSGNKTNTTVSNRVRGLQGRQSKSNFERILVESYGKQTAQAVLTSMIRFMPNITLPLRDLRYDCTGFAYPPCSYQASCLNSSEETWGLFPNIKVSFERPASRQKCSPVLKEDEIKYLRKDAYKISVLLGPYEKQRFLKMKFGEPIDLNDYLHGNGNVSRDSISNKRHGWLLNVGARVLSMSWAPIQNSKIQYLAITTEKSLSTTSDSPFIRAEGYESSIQIWAFNLNEPRGGDVPRDQKFSPHLAQVICTRWGNCRRLKWSPATFKAQDSPYGEKKPPFGRLASIWADGHVRVIDVSLVVGGTTSFVQYQASEFEACPPNTLCSCLDWLSATDLAVGCANGFVALWDLSCNAVIEIEMTTADNNTMPYFYEEVSETYILEIASAAPKYPHLLGCISVSGFLKMIDLRRPVEEQVTPPRSRIYATSLKYSPHVEGFFTTDDHGDIALLLGRRFFGAKRIMPTSDVSTGGAVLATSPCHTSILVGTTSGVVSCSNPIRKQMDTRNPAVWAQRWLVHEWRERLPAALNSYADVSEYSSNIQSLSREEILLEAFHQRQSVVRITEGYKADRVRGMERRTNSQAQPAIIYNEEQAVTSIEWNTNIEFGGWSAVGFGSGLLRVEDISL